jgi:hypothetical protein
MLDIKVIPVSAVSLTLAVRLRAPGGFAGYGPF